MPRLGEILLAIHSLTENELDYALENHVLHGVKLGTCLVEMGYVSDEVIARCLGKQAGRAFLTKDQLIAAGGQNLSVISHATMKKHRIIPVGIDHAALRVASDTAFSAKKQAELESFFRKKVERVAVSGYAVDCFLEEMFGIQRPGRFLATFSTKNPSDEPPPVVTDKVECGNPAHDTVPHSLSDAAKRLILARSRDDVAKAVLDFVSGFTGASALLIVKDDMVHGWKAGSHHQQLSDINEFSNKLELLPDLQQCVARKQPYFGRCTTPETELFRQALLFKGGEAAYFPIVIRQRVAAVLVCEEREKLNFDEVAEVCRKASYALEILILRAKLLG